MQAKMYKWSNWVSVTEPMELSEYFDSLLKKCGFNVVDECAYHFKPYGFTMLFLLSESHFAIHTFPEENKTYLELTSCARAPFDNFVKKIEKYEYILKDGEF